MPGERPPSGWDAFAALRAGDLLRARDASYEDLCQQVLDAMRRHIPTDSPILDVGSGLGALTRKIADEGFPVIGADTAPKSVAIARATFGVNCVVGGPLVAYEHNGHRPFGGAVANMVFHCVRDPQSLFRDVGEVLVPGSRLIFTVPDATWMANHQNTLLAVQDVSSESFTQHEVIRQFQTGGNSYPDADVHYFLYESPVAYLRAASPYFKPVEHIPVATPLNREVYDMGETERSTGLEDAAAALPDIDMFILQRL